MIRRYGPALVFMVGVAAAAVLAVNAGLGAIAEALARIGWRGLAAVCGLQVLALVLCALAWRAVAGRVNLFATLMARWIRDGTSNLVGFIPIIGEAISSRALTLFGDAGGREAAASTIVDVAAEQLALGLYSVIGLLLLMPYLGVADAARWSLAVAVAAVPIVIVYVLSRHKGALRLAERLALKALGRPVQSAEGGGLAEAVHAIYIHRGQTALAVILHLAGWVVAAVQVWAAAQALGEPLDLGACVALASLVAAARAAFFLVPMAAGVQEGGFMLVGAALGVDATTAIALSLILRARDLVFGAPSLIAWYVAEGREAARRRAERRG